LGVAWDGLRYTERASVGEAYHGLFLR